MKFRGFNCSRSGKLFPLVCSFFPLLSSRDLHGLTPIASLVPGQAIADTLCAQRATSPRAEACRFTSCARRFLPAVAIVSLLLFWVSHLAKKWWVVEQSFESCETLVALGRLCALG